MQKNTTAKLRRAKQLSLILILAALIFVWNCVSVYISVSDQNLTLEILACSESAQARYACFKKGGKGEFERAKKMEAIRRPARDTKEDFLLYHSCTPKDNAKNYLLEIMQEIKYSRSQNISQK